MGELENLAGHRDAILLLEFGAWLHMLGKYDWRFIEKNCGGNTKYDYKKFMTYDEFDINYPNLFKIFDSSSSTYKNIILPLSNLPITIPKSIGVLIRKHQETNKARKDGLSDHVTKLLVEAHGRGSNIDKSEINIEYPIQKQNIPEVYISTSFGFSDEARIIKELGFKNNELYSLLELIAEKLQSSLIFRKDPFRKRIASHFRLSLAETRLPFNDVTLFDQTASTVAFFKAALAERILDGKWKPLKSDPNNPNSDNQYKWRTLTIPFSGLLYLESISGIIDLLGRKRLILKAQNALQKLMEATYPLGQEIYRDEQICVYLVPDDPDLLKWKNKKDVSLETLIRRAVGNITQGELQPDLEKSLMPRGTRTVYTIGKWISEFSKYYFSSDFEKVGAHWENKKNIEICSNCGLRPQGPLAKARDRNVCDLCLKRREERSKEWTAQLDANATIWVDEVADSNARLALIVGNWGLDHWLDGTFIGSIIAVPKEIFLEIEKNCKDSLSKNINGDDEGFNGCLESLFSTKIIEDIKTFRNYFETIIKPEWQDIEAIDLNEETMAAIHLVRQNPSFSRIRRVWETTRRFWQETLPTDEEGEIENSLIGSILDKSLPRLSIKGTVNPEEEEKDNPPPYPYHSYELKLADGINLSVVWDEKNKGFISSDNLAYLEKPELLNRPVKEVLLDEGKEFPIEESTGYGGANKRCGILQVEKVEEMGDGYFPAIPILAEPRTFMALVPADKALEIAEKIHTKYQREMGKVRNRLPLHLGIVYAHRRTPFRAVLDAGRRMLRQRPLGGDTVWTVQQDAIEDSLPQEKEYLKGQTKQFEKTIQIGLEQNDRSFTWYVPARMGDGATCDEWYPYVFFHSDKDGNQEPGGRDHIFKGLRPTSGGETKAGWLVHAKGLKAGDEVYFTPGTVDIEWLDTSARRFEIAYGKDGRRYQRKQRPYLLDELEILSRIWDRISSDNGLTNSQIHALNETIELRREQWRFPELDEKCFCQFCQDIIRNADWKQKPSQKEIEKLSKWAVKGLLREVIELYMKIMKQKSKRDQSGQER